jgi:glycosyltransferase involved in cell wall biosynthesis
MNRYDAAAGSVEIERGFPLKPAAADHSPAPRGRVGLITAHGWVGISTPVLMAARYLAQSGFEVDLFIEEDPSCQALGIALPEFKEANIRIIRLPRQAPPAAIPAIAGGVSAFDLSYVQRARKLAGDYQWLVGFDPQGLIRAALLADHWRVPLIYHSLEIHDKEDDLKRLEREFSRRALLTVTQDEIRADLLASLNRVPRARVVVVYNSSLGELLPGKRDHFREKFAIPSAERIVLAVGTLLPQHGIDRIIGAAPSWPSGFVLVLHGWIPNPAFDRWVRGQCAAHPDRIFLSTDLLPAERKSIVFQSADIGLVFFSPDDTNLTYASGSSGKIFDFMQAGVPIIANDLPGLRDLIEGNGCGRVVPRAEDIGAALPAIVQDYAPLREGALKSFGRYGFAESYQSLIQIIEAAISVSSENRAVPSGFYPCGGARLQKAASMQIVHLCSMDHGGAAIAAMRLNAGLAGAGLRSTMLVMTKKGQDARVKVILPASGGQARPLTGDSFAHNEERWGAVCRRFSSLLAPYPRRSRQLEIFTDADADVRLAALPEVRCAEVVVLHWVAGMLDYAEFAEAFKGKRVVWVFHDLNPMTGGCHYPDGCSKYRAACGACPQLGSSDEQDLSRRIWLKKKKSLAGCDFTIVTPSRWLGECAAASPIHGGKKIVSIPNGVPTDIFRPHPREELRKELGLGPEDQVILFGADSLTNPRKGFAYLRAAVNSYQQSCKRKVTLVCFGEVPAGFDPQLNCRLLLTGFLRDEIQLARLFSLADAFAIPSREDNLPNTAIEAMACGLPIAGFRTGGIPEIVSHGVTGHLADRLHPDSLAESLAWCLDPDRREETRAACREKALAVFTSEGQTRAYLALIRETGPMPPVIQSGVLEIRQCPSSIVTRRDRSAPK